MTKYFNPKKIRKGTGSPGREYSDEFFYEKFPKLLLKKNIKMLDIACGSGYIREILFSLGYNIDYTGLDIERRKSFDDFSRFSRSSKFIESKIEDFHTEEKYDLVFSISGLEHIEDDFLAIVKADDVLAEGGIQIHSVPAPWSFPLYLRHGYRRYSETRLRKMFSGKEIEIYRLGGFFSFLLHFVFITISRFIIGNRGKRGVMYTKFIKLANKLDPILPFFSSTHIVITKK